MTCPFSKWDKELYLSLLNTSIFNFVERYYLQYPHKRLKRILLYRKFGFLNKSSKLSFPNKIIIFKSILKPTWTYEIVLWGSAKPVNIQRPSLQSKVLRTILNVPWYVSNYPTHNNLNIPTVSEVIKSKFHKSYTSFSAHPNSVT